MAMYKVFQFDPGSQCAIWKIEEPESFFSGRLGFSAIHKSAKRRLEHLGSRFLLKYLMPDLPIADIKCSPQGKPFLEDAAFKFSISHSFPYVAVAIARQDVGIDIQIFQEKISRLQHKFLSEEEQVLFEDDIQKITLAWTAKEAAFKWFGDGQVDFIRQMPIRKFELNRQEALLEMDFRRTDPQQMLRLSGGLEPEFAWSVTNMAPNI